MSLEAIENFLTSVALKGEKLGHRYSWRLGEWVQTGTRALHETYLRATRRLGWCVVDIALVQSVQALRTNQKPGYPLLSIPAEKISPRADELLKGIVILSDGREARLNEISWLKPQFSNALTISSLLFQSLHWVKELLDAYNASGNAGYRDRAKELTGKWIEECLYTERSAWIWDDHGTALRALVLCELWVACRNNESPGSPFMQALLTAILKHAEKLAHKSVYRPGHNHGVTQAYALLAIGLLFSLHPKAQHWAMLGCQRLEAQMAENVSSEGLHREHSPFYHFFVFRQFDQAYRLAKAYGLEFSQNFTDRLHAMLAAGAYLIKPDGALPALGDSAKKSVIMVQESDLAEWTGNGSQEYLYSITKGIRGKAPQNTSVYFPNAGYAFFRSGWGDSGRFEEERFLALRLSTFKTTHIHRDVLSFELYAYGKDLIVDSGGPFAYGHPNRAGYFLSTRAHNTIVVDDKDQSTGEARLLHWSTSPQCDILDAEHSNYAGITHRRLVVFIRKQYFLIIDRLESSQSHQYSQLFHLNPDLQVSLKGLSAETHNVFPGATVQIVPLLERGVGVRLHRGINHLRQGWVSLEDGEMDPNVVVEYEQMAANTIFVVLVVPQPAEQFFPVSGHMEGTLFQSQTEISLSVAGHDDVLLFSPDGDLTIAGMTG